MKCRSAGIEKDRKNVFLKEKLSFCDKKRWISTVSTLWLKKTKYY